MAARDLHLRVDIGTDPLDRAGGFVEDIRRVKPNLEDLLNNFPVKLFLSREVVMQVRLG